MTSSRAIRAVTPRGRSRNRGDEVCGYCGRRTSGDDIVVALTRDGSSETRVRLRLAQRASDVFAVAGISVRAWSDCFVVSNRTGRTLVVDRFLDVAVVASRLAGGAAETFDGHGAAELAALIAPFQPVRR